MRRQLGLGIRKSKATRALAGRFKGSRTLFWPGMVVDGCRRGSTPAGRHSLALLSSGLCLDNYHLCFVFRTPVTFRQRYVSYDGPAVALDRRYGPFHRAQSMWQLTATVVGTCTVYLAAVGNLSCRGNEVVDDVCCCGLRYEYWRSDPCRADVSEQAFAGTATGHRPQATHTACRLLGRFTCRCAQIPSL
jgi:hypothetical protein